MPTFSISIPDEDERIISEAAERNQRSRTAQLRLIIKEWLEMDKRRHQLMLDIGYMTHEGETPRGQEGRRGRE